MRWSVSLSAMQRVRIAVLIMALPVAHRASEDKPPWNMLVLDPLARQNACACVEGYAQRDYNALASALQTHLQRPVHISFGSTTVALRRDVLPDIVVAKHSMLAPPTASVPGYAPLAMLTDKNGKTTHQGLLVVRSRDKFQRPAELKNRLIALGPTDEHEKHGAMLELLRRAGVHRPRTIIVQKCSQAALDLLDKRVDAAAISSYAMPLLTGCGTIPAGSLRVIGRTQPLPFVCVFVRRDMSGSARSELVEALRRVRSNPLILNALESRDGFVTFPQASSTRPQGSAGPASARNQTQSTSRPPLVRDWSDWRGGPLRNALVPSLPTALPEPLQALWLHRLASNGVGGVSVARGKVYCSDRSVDGTRDIWLCLDASTGTVLWRLEYLAPGKMDYTSSPRASPVIVGQRAFLLGAFGHLHAVHADTGVVLWKRDLVREFGGTVPTWGIVATPLVVGNLVIVPTGSQRATLAALDVATGRTVWATPGRPPGYGNAILITAGGQRQVVWHDRDTLGGWDLRTGRRLWSLKPPNPNDFNVPTPVWLGDRLLIATENNGTRIYRFAPDGRISPRPLAHNDDARPNTASPVVTGRTVWVSSETGLYALDLERGLKTVWKQESEPFLQHASLIGASDRMLAVLLDGRVCLLPARPGPATTPQLGRLPVQRPPDDDEIAVWSHPAVVGDRLYVRTNREVVCVGLR